MHKNPIRKKVVIFEDDPDIRKSFEIIVNSSSRFQVVGSFDSCEAGLPSLSRTNPNIVMMDIGLPGISGIEGVAYIRERLPQTDIVMVTVHEDSELVFRALKAGASGYVSKSSNYAELLSALDEVAKGGAPMSSRIARMVIEDFHLNPNTVLGKRETEVLKLLAGGMTYRKISEQLGISTETSKTHIKNIYRKLKVNKKSEAIEKGVKERII